MTLLDYDPERQKLILHAGPRDHESAKKVPGLHYESKSGLWTGIPAWATMLALRGEFGLDLELSPAANTWGFENVNRERYTAALKEWQPPEADLPAWAVDLLPLQRTAVGWLATQSHACLFDGTGGGKGVVTSVALSLLPATAFPALIVCPRSVKHTHARFLERWAPNLNAHVVQGTAVKRRKQIEAGLSDPAGVLVMNWESVIEHSSLAHYGSTVRSEKDKAPKELNDGRLKTAVFDEAHRAKDPTTKRTRAAWSVAHECERVWLTTATPITDPVGLWSVLHTVVPWETQSMVKYRDRYCLTEQVWVKGKNGPEARDVVRAFNPRTEGELRRIFAPYILRRSEDEIEPNLPERIYETMWVEMDKKQRDAYDSMAKHSLAEDGNGQLIIATDPMQASARLLQMAAGTPVMDDEGHLEEFIEPSCKVTALLDWLEDHGDEQVVVFAKSRKLLELCDRVLERKKISHALITGQITDGARGVAEDAFQAGELRVLLGTYGAMSEGLTLTAASTQLMLQRDFELIHNVQADGRCRRIGQTASHVTIIDVVAVDSYDESVFESGAYKEESAQQFLRDPDWIKRELEKRT